MAKLILQRRTPNAGQAAFSSGDCVGKDPFPRSLRAHFLAAAGLMVAYFFEASLRPSLQAGASTSFKGFP